MHELSLRPTRKSVLCAAAGFLLTAATSTSTFAVVTWDGTDGVSNRIFSNCTSACHGGSHQFNGADYDSVKSRSSVLISRVNAGHNISSSLGSLATQWNTDGLLKNAAPVASPSGATIDSSGFCVALDANLFPNGLASDVVYELVPGDGTAQFTSPLTDRSANPNTGGGVDSITVTSNNISLPTCDPNATTKYQYRVRGDNSTFPNTLFSTPTATFDLPACSGTVSNPDQDGDSVDNCNDNCPFNANPGQEDLDTDGLGDVCDSDRDGDGIPNLDETNSGLDPDDNTDAALDKDGDGLTNLAEYNQCQAVMPPFAIGACPSINDSKIPPVFSIADIVVPSTGYLTNVDSGITIDATLQPVKLSADINGPFRPGHYDLTWTAVDNAGFTTKAMQSLDVVPQVRLGGSQVTGENSTITIPVFLNGPAPNYPVDIQYTVSGSADGSDHDLVAGTVSINSGVSTFLTVNINNDAVAEPDETILVTLTGVSSSLAGSASANAALSNEDNYTVVITENPIAPVLKALTASQGATSSQQVYQDQGTVTVTVDATDGNGDILSYDWSGSDPDLNGSATPPGNQFTFDPTPMPGSLISAGKTYDVVVAISDGLFTVNHSIALKIGANQPSLGMTAMDDADMDGTNDASEGQGDADMDGIPDFLDPISDDPTLLNTRVSGSSDDNFTRVMQTTAGLSLALNSLAINAQHPVIDMTTGTNTGKVGANIFAADILDSNGNVVADPGMSLAGGAYDFRIHGLTSVQPVATVVIPLTRAVPANATLRKFSNDVWGDFLITATDGYKTATSNNGVCPPPGSAIYAAGLIAFSDCLELTLTDGSGNDGDGEVNGVIVDPSAIMVSTGSPPLTAPTSAPGGAGALDWWWIVLALQLLWLRRNHQKEIA